MYIGYLKGATAYEFQIGQYVLRLLRPKLWNRRATFIRLTKYKGEIKNGKASNNS